MEIVSVAGVRIAGGGGAALAFAPDFFLVGGSGVSDCEVAVSKAAFRFRVVGGVVVVLKVAKSRLDDETGCQRGEASNK
jgi:hypothetical protein